MHENDKKALRAVRGGLRSLISSPVGRAFLISGMVADGGPGSGNFNHEGRPGEVGGSGPGGGESESKSDGLDSSHIESMQKFHKALESADPHCYGSEEGIDAQVRSDYRREMNGLFSSEGQPFDFATRVGTMEEYVALPWGERVSSYVDYDKYKEYVLQNTPWEYSEPGSICDTLKRYNAGATPGGYGKGKGARIAFDQETGLSRFIDSHSELHYNGGTLYRGIETSKAGLAELKKALKNGGQITMRGPSSWSTEQRVADDFAKHSLRSTGRGTKVIFVDEGTKKRNAIPFPYSMEGIGGNQREVLYSGSASFKVKSMEERDGVVYVGVEAE